MLVGVKFCGGCNPTYDRAAAYTQIRTFFEKEKGAERRVRFAYAEAGVYYDLLLVISGCTSRCARLDEYRYGQLISLWRGDQIEAVIGEMVGKMPPVNA